MMAGNALDRTAIPLRSIAAGDQDTHAVSTF
jgi:hypothetical protein